MFIIAGILAALFSYTCNKIILKKQGSLGIIVIVPFIEEFTKTMSSVMISTSVIGTHFVFGVIEGIYDLVTSSKKIGKWAALASIVSHTLFGLATYLTIQSDYSIYWGIFLSWLIHSTWNWYITKKL